MKWKRDSKYSEVTGCGRYRVTKYTTKRDGQKVVIWMAIRMGPPSERLKLSSSEAACKQACAEIFRAGDPAK